ncbi:hypothetical protein [Anaerorhabdus sp.]|uniref:hypothetical protein n=2 Tax=Anaerorhabdus sp. TaxID=1872524 RepID=UPI002FC62725
METISKLLFGSVYFFILLGLVIVLLLDKRVREVINKNKKTLILFLLISLVVLNVLLYLHLSQESFIPSWDFGGFYRKTLEFSDKLNRSIPEAWDNIINSINFHEYNFVAEWFLYLPMKIIGNSFLRYAIAMANSFLIPTSLLLVLFYLLLTDNKKRNVLLDWTIYFVIILFGPNIYSLVQGYIGSAGLFFILILMMFIYLKKYEKVNIPLAILTGLLLLLLLIVRRWFAYWVVSFFVSLVLPYILIKDKRIYLKPIIINCFIAGVVALGILILAFNPLFKTITTYNYSEAYSVMKATGPVEVILSFIQTYGILFVLLMIFGIIKSYKKEEFWLSLICVVQIVVSVILFNQVQRFGSHHYYIINIPCLILIIMGMSYLTDFVTKKVLTIGLVLFNLLTVINYQKTLVLKNEVFKPLFIGTNLLLSEPLPMIRVTDRIDEIQALVSRLNNQAGDYDYFYTIASSSLFNEDILRNALLPYDINGLKNVIPSSVYDLRDYLPKDFFNYQYIIVSEPLILQFKEEEQRVVSILGHFILSDPIAKDYYKLIEDVVITNDIHIKVYRRTDTIPNDVRNYVSELFKEYYPNEPRMYEFTMVDGE